MNAIRFQSIFILFSALVVLSLSACGKGFKAGNLSPNSGAQLTGANNRNGIPFTGAGESLELQALKRAIDAKIPANEELASTITNVKINRTDKDGKSVVSKPDALEVEIGLEGSQTLKFKAALNHTVGEPSAKNIAIASGSSDLKLSVRCLDADCDSTELRLKSSSAEAGLIHRKRLVQVQALGPFNPDSTAHKLDRIESSIVSGFTSSFITTEVAWGPAMFDLKSGKLSASGDLVETGLEDENVSVKVEDDLTFVASLMGNNNRGDLLIRVSDQSAWAFLRITLSSEDRTSTDPAATPIADAPASSEKLIDFDLNHPITAQFQKDRAHPEIQRRMQDWKKSSRFTKFINRVRPNVAMMTALLAEKQIPPDLIFITLIESRYFVDSAFPIETSNRGAVGPWQFLDGTAKDHGLKLTPCDERGDIARSTQAAASYFSQLFKMFPADPKLAIMSYNWGQGSVGRALICNNHENITECMKQKISKIPDFSRRLRELQVAGLDFWLIRDLNVAPKESTEYVMNFLAANFLGRDPTQFGLSYDEKTYPVAPRACAK